MINVDNVIINSFKEVLFLGRVENKVAIITGAGSGMGAATARLFGQEGAKVVAVDMNLEGAENTVNEIKAQGGDAFAFKMDITSPEQWQAVVAKTVETYRRINVLANCAGIAGNFAAPPDGTPPEEFDLLVNVNLKGPWLGVKYCVPEMRKAGGGSIINISSIGGLVGGQGGSAYGVAKAGLRSLGKNSAVDYGKDNIRINTIFPGQITTPMSAALETPEMAEAKQVYINKIPMGRFGTPQGIAYAVLYLASDEAEFVTGAELVVDGGTTAQ